MFLDRSKSVVSAHIAIFVEPAKRKVKTVNMYFIIEERTSLAAATQFALLSENRVLMYIFICIAHYSTSVAGIH